MPGVDRREAFAKEDVGTPEQFGLQGENTLKTYKDWLLKKGGKDEKLA